MIGNCFLIELQRGSRSSFDDNIYDCIMPDNFLADSPITSISPIQLLITQSS